MNTLKIRRIIIGASFTFFAITGHSIGPQDESANFAFQLLKAGIGQIGYQIRTGSISEEKLEHSTDVLVSLYKSLIAYSLDSKNPNNAGVQYVQSLITASHDARLASSINEQVRPAPLMLSDTNFRDAVATLFSSGKSDSDFLAEVQSKFPSGSYANFVNNVKAASEASVNTKVVAAPIIPTVEAITTAVTNNTSSSGTPAVLPAVTSSSTPPVVTAFSALSNAVLAVARTEGSTFAESDHLANSTFGASGALTGYNVSNTLFGGNTTAASVCTASQCPEGETIRWGIWSSGTAIVSGTSENLTSNTALHYIVGSPTTPSQFASLTGTASYVPMGGTTPTGIDGRNYTAAIGNVAVNFTLSSANLTSYALSGNGVNTADFTFSNVPLTLANSNSGSAKVISNIAQVNGAGNYLSISGFFAGSGAQYIGAAIKVLEPSGFAGPGLSVSQVQAFKK